MRILVFTALFFAFSLSLFAQKIPEVAWNRGIGEPLENPGVTKVRGNIDDGYWQGVPIGGLGSGSIGRTYRGDFARWHLKAGVHKYVPVLSNAFAAFEQAEGSRPTAMVLVAGKPAGRGGLGAWNWSYPAGGGKYYALFPKAWYNYQLESLPVHLVCEQFSPVWANNYRESSYPVGVFLWHATNPTEKPVKVSILFSWTNMVGWFGDFGRGLSPWLGSGNFNRARSEKLSGGRVMKGIVFDRARSGPCTVRCEGGPVETDSDGQFAIAAIEDSDTQVTFRTTFDAGGNGAEVWERFSRDGTLEDPKKNWLSSGSNAVAGALAVSFTVAPGATRDVPMVLAWDLPIVQFGAGRRWYRRYTAFFGTAGTAAWQIARAALENYRSWSRAIDDWQRPIVSDATKPAWYRAMLFNELYDLVDGGTFWENGEVGVPSVALAKEGKRVATAHHHFTYLECFDYPYYSTLDVRFYASWALLKLWPELEKEEMRQFADTVSLDYRLNHEIGSDHTLAPRKARGALPHDLGNPIEDPILRVNQYNWQNVTVWKDLNSKFVLQVYRDYALTGARDVAFLRYCWPAVKQALDYLKRFDTRGDGLPQNEGIPDQTYDTWGMRGTSAYCGSLWLASLEAAVKMSEKVGAPHEADKYRQWYDQAQPNFVRELWNGRYFDYDTGSADKANVMADQLVGQWYADLCGLGDIVPKEMTRKSLESIFKLNVMGFQNGEMGAVNGINLDGTLVKSNEQSEEVWTGTTLALASFLKSRGMRDEAYKTAWGIYNVVYAQKGYWFRTPEAWNSTGNFRASMYMRPQAIWAMEFVR